MGEAVIVLGYRNRGRRANAINRWRVRAGLRSQQENLGPSRLVLCGGGEDGHASEADLMSVYVRHVCRYAGELVVETKSRSTWENVQNVTPLIEDVGRIKIVSNSLHAEKARLYLWKSRPDLALRLVRADDYQFGEFFLLKPIMAMVGLRNLRKMMS